MKPTAYIETSVVSYLTARPSRDVVVAAFQQITREWWDAAADRFDLVASALVVAEAGAAPDEGQVRDALKGLLAAYKVPKRVFFVPELPRNTMGKVQKNVLRDAYADTYSA